MTDTALTLDAAGWLGGARQVRSANCDDRPDGELPSLIVMHSISLPPGEYGGREIEDLFTNQLDSAAHPYFKAVAGLRVSAHFLIRRDGQLIQFVSINKRAWHAGVSCWAGRERCNDYSIGIELEGDDSGPFEDAQYVQLMSLLTLLRRGFPVEAVIGHCDIAPGRKTDPGPYFEWHKIRAVMPD
jgi:AmpD protein